MHLTNIVRRETTHLGLCDASGIRAGGVWLNPSWSRHNQVWCHPWPTEIIADLVLSTNLDGQITKSALKRTALVLHKSTLLVKFPE